VLQDLRRGQLTLPIISAMASAKPREQETLAHLLQQAQQDPVAARAAADLAEELGGKQYATDYARRLVGEALEKLFPLPDGTAKAGLQDLAQYVVERQY
jgi:geranylgeranyl pyrophosphate synthase